MSNMPDNLNKDIKSNLRYITEYSENLISRTDEYYSVVNELLPDIEKNIELTNQETELLIDYFLESKDINDLENTSLDDFFVSRVLMEIKNEFEKVSSLLLNKSEVDELLASFSALKEGEKTSFNNFFDLLKEMENVLLRVKEISYNSIIFSARLGTEGKGFNVISDNLRETSGVLEDNINNINKLADDSTNWHGDFREKINHITTKREEAVKSYSENLDDELITILKSMDRISELLKDLLKNVKTKTEPFQELMSFVERQEIIRLNLENLIKSLYVLERKYDQLQSILEQEKDQEKDKILDLIVFLDRGMELLHELIENIKTQIEGSLKRIINTTENLVKGLEEINYDSIQLAEFLADESQSKNKSSTNEEEVSSALGYTFKNLIESMDEFIELLKEVKEDVDDLIEKKYSFDQNIEDLSNELEKVYKQVKFLQKVKLLSNIEVSRIEEQGRLVGDRINSIVERIQDKVYDNKDAFDQLSHDLNKDLSKLDELVIVNQESINNSLDDVEASSKKLKTAKEAISNAVVALIQEVESLNKDIERIQEELKSVDTLYKFVGKLTKYSKGASKLIKEEKEKIWIFTKLKIGKKVMKN